MSDAMRSAICALLTTLEILAKFTKNPVDDAVIKAIKSIIGCK